ncbi:MAG: hypothetical protein BWY85_00121 [Firmicutes bacterium ADurb.Bin506]|nr:MAG: hypothetical protein BWY85_00121 [Firmicutes bacterium ADurb.Bin506]
MSDTTEPSRTRLVRTDCLVAFGEAIDKINKKCEKLGLQPVSWKEIGPRKIQYRHADRIGGSEDRTPDVIVRWCDSPPPYTFAESPDTVREITTVEISWVGQIMLPGGWRLRGVVERAGVTTEDGQALNEVRGAPGAGDLSMYRKVPLDCDHCKQNRRRNKVILVQNEAGYRKQVGTGCVADYLGVATDAMLKGVLAIMNDLWDGMSVDGADGDNVYGGGGRREPAWEIGRVGMLATCCALQEGFVSRKAAECGKLATADWIMAYLTDTMLPEDKKRIDGWMAEERVLKEWAQTAVQLDALNVRVAQDDGGLSDFEYTVGLNTLRGYVTRKSLGVVVAYCALAPLRRQRDLEKANKAAAEALLPPPEYVGTVDARLNIDVEVMRIYPYEGTYGLKVIVTMRQVGTRNTLVWFASGWNGVEAARLCDNAQPAPGVHKIDVLVKGHKEGKYGKETVVQKVVRRLSPEELVAADTARKAARKAARALRKEQAKANAEALAAVERAGVTGGDWC